MRSSIRALPIGFSVCLGVLAITGCGGLAPEPEPCADGTCVAPRPASDVCAAQGKITSAEGTCLTPDPSAADCAAKGRVLSADGRTCIGAPVKKPTAAECAAQDKVLSTDGTTCVAAPPKYPSTAECAAQGKVLSDDGRTCVAPPPRGPSAEECAARKTILSDDAKSCVAATAGICVRRGKELSFDGARCVTNAPGYTFKARFGSVDVEFEGPSRAVLKERCIMFMDRSSLARVDTIVIDDATYRNASAYWQPANLCAVATLNAKRTDASPVMIRGMVQDLPFAIQDESYAEFETLVSFDVAALAAGQKVDTFILNDATHHQDAYYWNGDDIVAFLRYASPRNVGPLVAKGTIEGAPFVFTGKDARAIEEECTDYFMHTSTWITRMDDMVVNDATLRSDSVYWKPADVCMMARTHAR
jgi:hypothetical protein